MEKRTTERFRSAPETQRLAGQAGLQRVREVMRETARRTPLEERSVVARAGSEVLLDKILSGSIGEQRHQIIHQS